MKTHKFLIQETMTMPDVDSLAISNLDNLKSIVKLSKRSVNFDTDSLNRMNSWGIHGSLAIENNPLTANEVYDVITTWYSKINDPFYFMNPYIVQVINMLAALKVSTSIGFTGDVNRSDLNEWHELLMGHQRSIIDSRVEIGKIRNHDVRVGRYICPSHYIIDDMLKHFIQWINHSAKSKHNKIVKAIVAHAWFVSIHPYGDGNGRMARLLELAMLRQAWIPEYYSHSLSEFYWNNRLKYYEMLDGVHGNEKEGKYRSEMKLDEFVEWAIQGLLQGINERYQYITNKVG